MNERVKKIRQTKGMTQKQFGNFFGVSDATVTQIEKGKVELNEPNLLAICYKLNVNEHWLRTGEGEMFNPPKGDNLADYPFLHSEAELEMYKTLLKFGKDILNVVTDFVNELEKKSKG